MAAVSTDQALAVQRYLEGKFLHLVRQLPQTLCGASLAGAGIRSQVDPRFPQESSRFLWHPWWKESRVSLEDRARHCGLVVCPACASLGSQPCTIP